jgi:hypothetical protein
VKALLRFQQVVLLRAATQPLVLLYLALPSILLVFALLMRGSIDGDAWLGLSFIAIGALVLPGMATTYTALDAVRWSAPIRPSRLVAAHARFWLSVLAAPTAVATLLWTNDPFDAALLFFHMLLVVLAASAVMPFFARMGRHSRGVLSAVACVLVALLIWPAAISLGLQCRGHRAVGFTVIAIVSAVATAIGATSLLCDEIAPLSRAEGPIVRTIAERRVARSPLTAMWITAYSPSSTTLWVLFGGALPLAFPTAQLFTIWVPLAASNLAGIALQSWRWLAATPIDRGRAFRILFGPALAFVFVVMAGRIAIVETTSDRTVFFRDQRREGFQHVGSTTLTLAFLLKTGPTGNGYVPAEASEVAEGVRRHLEENYGLLVPTERIETDLRRGWPDHPTPGSWDVDMGYVLDGLERVRADLGDEIAWAGRRRDLLIAVGVVLAFLVLLRVQFKGRVLGVVLVVLVGLPLATLAVGRRESPRFAAATDDLYRAIFRMPPAAMWTLVAGACVVGVFLWRNSVAAFRRIDVLDIPPNPTASLWR